MSDQLDYESFHGAVAELMELSESLGGVQRLRWMSYTRDTEKTEALTEACLDHGVIDTLLRSFDLTADADKEKRHREAVKAIEDLASLSAGVLLEHGVAEKLCSMVCLDTPDAVVIAALKALNSIVENERAPIDAIVQRGILAHLYAYMGAVYQRFASVDPKVITTLSAVMHDGLTTRLTSQLTYCVVAPMVPHLAFALRHFQGFPDLRDALINATNSLTLIFNFDRDDGSFADLVSGGENSVIRCVVSHLHVKSATHMPAQRLCRRMAQYRGDKAALVFTPDVLARLQRLAASLEYMVIYALFDLVDMLSHLVAKGPEMEARVLESNVLQTAIMRLAEMTRGSISNDFIGYQVTTPLSAITTELLARALTPQARLARAQMLLDAGVLRYYALILAIAAGAIDMPPARICKAVQLMVQCGDTGADPAVQAEGAQPRNVFLAAFFAAGGRDALARTKSKNADVASLNKCVIDIVGDIST